MTRFRVLVCRGPECGEKRNSKSIADEFRKQIDQAGLSSEQAQLSDYSCFGQCQRGVNVLVHEVTDSKSSRYALFMPTRLPGAQLYCGIGVAHVKRIVEEHLSHGKPAADLLCSSQDEKET